MTVVHPASKQGFLTDSGKYKQDQKEHFDAAYAIGVKDGLRERDLHMEAVHRSALILF